MLNVLKLFALALTAVMLSCADYKELNLEPIPSEPIKDSRDGNEYETVTIGKQVWMAKNLKYEGEEKNIGVCYGDKNTVKNPDNCENYGKLYTWAEAMGYPPSYNEQLSNNYGKRQGICPNGWHIPSKEEWDILVDYVGLNSEEKLKSKEMWYPGLNGLDEYGFKALPGGTYWTQGYKEVSKCAFWWSSTELEATQTQSTWICPDTRTDVPTDKIFGADKRENSLLSVRCIKN